MEVIKPKGKWSVRWCEDGLVMPYPRVPGFLMSPDLVPVDARGGQNE